MLLSSPGWAMLVIALGVRADGTGPSITATAIEELPKVISPHSVGVCLTAMPGKLLRQAQALFHANDTSDNSPPTSDMREFAKRLPLSV